MYSLLPSGGIFIILGLLAYTYVEMKKLNLRQIIMSVGLSLIIATPAGGFWGILTLSILLEFGFLSCPNLLRFFLQPRHQPLIIG